MNVTGIGAVMTIHFSLNGNITNALELEDRCLKDIFWHFMIQRGYYLARRGMISLILGTTKEEVQGIIATVREFMASYQALLTLDAGTLTSLS